MIKYLFNLYVISCASFLVQMINCRTITEDELINSMPYNATNYLSLLSLVNSTVHSKSQVINTTDNSTKAREDTKTMPDYMSNVLPPNECLTEINNFGVILSDFIRCLLINEVPFNICIKCARNYDNLYSVYKRLRNQTISKCPNTFLDSDRISLINYFYVNSISQWNNGNCNNCYARNEHLMVNNDTVYYKHLANNYKLCVEDKEASNLTNTSCIACEEAFNEVNDYYDLITSNYSSQVCYDIVDSMKNIRQHWSDDLSCPVTSTQTLHILGIVMIVLMLPFVLYLAGRLFCVEKNKTLMTQKRLAAQYSRSESTPLINPIEN